MSRNSGDNMMGGAADKHSAKAREEAAKKLINGHVPILRDVTNGAPVTQLELQRVPTDYARFVDEMMREVAWRLIGGQRSSPPARPTTPVQAQTWSMAAQYLQSRIAIPRDLGPEAGAAFKAVILEVATVALSSFGGAGNGAGDPPMALADVNMPSVTPLSGVNERRQMTPDHPSFVRRQLAACGHQTVVMDYSSATVTTTDNFTAHNQGRANFGPIGTVNGVAFDLMVEPTSGGLPSSFRAGINSGGFPYIALQVRTATWWQVQAGNQA